MKLAGAITIVLSCLYAAVLWNRTRKERISTLEGLIRCLNVMEAELGGKASPLPGIMALLSREKGTAGLFFASVSKELDKLGMRPFYEIWNTAAHTRLQTLSDTDREAVAALGRALGRYPLPMQLEAVIACREGLREKLHAERQANREQTRLSWALALSFGFLLWIVLI